MTGQTRLTHARQPAALPRIASEPPLAEARAFDQAMMEALLAHKAWRRAAQRVHLVPVRRAA